MNTDRERSILKILVHDKKVTVKDLSTRLFTSEPSIRRDLVSLERQHLLKRIYGGAILDDNDVSLHLQQKVGMELHPQPIWWLLPHT